jgi:hypothetical protein
LQNPTHIPLLDGITISNNPKILSLLDYINKLEPVTNDVIREVTFWVSNNI